MASINDLQESVTTVGKPAYKTITWLHVASDNPSATGFSGLALDVNASGTVTTYYYWLDTSGKMRYGSTAPTVSTQNTAGTAIGS